MRHGKSVQRKLGRAIAIIFCSCAQCGRSGEIPHTTDPFEAFIRGSCFQLLEDAADSTGSDDALEEHNETCEQLIVVCEFSLEIALVLKKGK